MAYSTESLSDHAVGDSPLAGSFGSGAAGGGSGPQTYEVTVSAGIGLQANLVAGGVGDTFEATVSAMIRTEDQFDVIRAQAAAVVEDLVVQFDVIPSHAPVIRERVRIAATVRAPGIYRLIVSDQVRLRDAMVLAFDMPLVESLGVVDALSEVLGVRLLERVAFASTLTGGRVRGILVSEQLRVSDTLLQQMLAEVLEAVGLGASTEVIQRTFATMVEDLRIAEFGTPSMLLRATAQETVGLDDEQLVNAILTGALSEGIELSGGFVDLSGSYTTWTMNVGSGAVSEYTNYQFNSFARVGNKYIGANATGLYELLGDDDAGEDIIATLRGGYMQFGGVQQSRLKAAYLATRGGGDYILRIETAEGAYYNYLAQSLSMRTAKVHMGKGQRARYFAYELTSTGQDFDFESLEFVPLVLQRRV